MTSGQRMTVLTDRSQGGTSMRDGQVELMVHRRLLHDDNKGVVEPLNETAYGTGLVAKGTHWLHLTQSSPATDARWHRLRAEQVFMDAQLTFARTQLSSNEFANSFEMTGQLLVVNATLPESLHLLTLERRKVSLHMLYLSHT